MTVLGVVGAGTMGAGIAQLSAAAGFRTLLHDPVPVPLGIAIWGLAGFGVGLSYAPLSVTMRTNSPVAERGLSGTATRRARSTAK